MAAAHTCRKLALALTMVVIRKGKEKEEVHPESFQEAEPFLERGDEGDGNAAEHFGGMPVKREDDGGILAGKFEQFVDDRLVSAVNAVEDAPGDPGIFQPGIREGVEAAQDLHGVYNPEWEGVRSRRMPFLKSLSSSFRRWAHFFCSAGVILSSMRIPSR